MLARGGLEHERLSWGRSNRELRTFFERFPPQERAARADVAVVYDLNEVHPSFFDALAADKPPTADQAAWLWSTASSTACSYAPYARAPLRPRE